MATSRQRTRGGVPRDDKLGDFVSHYTQPSPYRTTPLMAPPYVPYHQMTVDEVHPNHPYEGGPFESRRYSTKYTDGSGLSGRRYHWYGTDFADYYDGSYRVISPNAIVNFPSSASSEASSLGPTGWNRFRPAKPEVSMGQWLAELRSAPQMMFKRLNKFRDLGNNYLAVEFGWKPFLRDLSDFWTSLYTIDKSIYQLKRDNGRVVRRGGTLFTTVTSESNERTDATVAPANWLSGCKTTTTTTTLHHAWFKGSFRYYIPALNSKIWGTARAASQIYGLNITPELLWELMPWSWLIDWTANVGAVIGNFSASVLDNLTSAYSYIMLRKMETTTASATYDISLMTNPMVGYEKHSGSSSVTMVKESKTRVVANPYGFDSDFASLNAKQVAILTALGLTKVKF